MLDYALTDADFRELHYRVQYIAILNWDRLETLFDEYAGARATDDGMKGASDE